MKTSFLPKGSCLLARIVPIGVVALALLIPTEPLAGATVKKLAEDATGAATWRVVDNGDPSGVPTEADDVIFDYTYTSTITSMARHTAPNDTFVANSLTFGSAAGLGTFEFRNGNTGAPWENGHIESFHDKFRDELLNRELFGSLLEAKQRRIEYNQKRPHSSLGYQTPHEFAESCRTPLRPTDSAPSDNFNLTTNQMTDLYL